MMQQKINLTQRHNQNRWNEHQKIAWQNSMCIIEFASSKKKQMLCDAHLAKVEVLHPCIVLSTFEGAT
jgi:hypothetical protein